MLKKKLFVILFSLAASAAYADAPVMTYVTGDMINQPFNIDKTQWGYEFNNETGKTLTFTLTVARTSEVAVDLQCWHDLDPVEEYQVQPGEIKYCVTVDSIRVVTGDLPASGFYTITVGSN